jgi:hypothetical protein
MEEGPPSVRAAREIFMSRLQRLGLSWLPTQACGLGWYITRFQRVTILWALGIGEPRFAAHGGKAHAGRLLIAAPIPAGVRLSQNHSRCGARNLAAVRGEHQRSNGSGG